MKTFFINASPDESPTPGEVSVQRRIKGLYAQLLDQPGRICYIYAQPHISGFQPDFLILDNFLGVSILEVKDWSDGYIDKINAVKVVTVDGKNLKNPSLQTSSYYGAIKNLLESSPNLLNKQGLLEVNITANLILPNITSGFIEKIRNVLSRSNVNIIAKDSFKSLEIKDIFVGNSSIIPELEMKAIRYEIFPELRIGRINDPETITPIKDLKVLDAEQDKFAKKIPNGHYMLTGVPGSGKTVILIARAIHLLQTHPDWTIQIITYTKALAKRISTIIDNGNVNLLPLNIDTSQIVVSTFHQLCFQLIGKPNFPDGMTKDEFHNSYWPEQALNGATPQYDAVLIDEYQDFHESWFKLSKAVCKRKTTAGREYENLLMAGDRLQRIYPVEWDSYAAMGINIRGGGRSVLLKNSYRTGKEHISFALEFLANDAATKKEVTRFYELDANPAWTPSKEGSLQSINGDFSDIIDSIRLQLLDNFPAEDIIILCRTRQQRTDLFNALPANLASDAVAGNNPTPGRMLITTYHSAKGLEAKVCIVLGIDEFNRINTTHRRLLYVGMTRAAERLILHSFDQSKGFAPEISKMLE